MNRTARRRLLGPLAAIWLAAVWLAAGPVLAAGDYVIQLASVKSEERALAAWSEMQAKHAELLGDLKLTVQATEVTGRGMFYRMQTGPFPNKATAEDMCLQLRAVKLDCLVRQR